MKTLIVSAILAFVIQAHSQQQIHAHASDVSVHGMFVFPNTNVNVNANVFLNHLPMFMPTHAEQAIFEATLDDNGAFAKATSGLVTLVPEPMSLKELIAKPHAFYADLYDGHFERGGQKIASHILVSVTKVVHAHAIGAAQPQPDIEFGNCKAHFITKAPDFDEIWCGGEKIYREDDDLQ